MSTLPSDREVLDSNRPWQYWRTLWETAFDSARQMGCEDMAFKIGPAAQERDVETIEAELGCRLPESFRRTLTEFSAEVLVAWEPPEVWNDVDSSRWRRFFWGVLHPRAACRLLANPSVTRDSGEHMPSGRIQWSLESVIGGRREVRELIERFDSFERDLPVAPRLSNLWWGEQDSTNGGSFAIQLDGPEAGRVYGWWEFDEYYDFGDFAQFVTQTSLLGCIRMPGQLAEYAVQAKGESDVIRCDIQVQSEDAIPLRRAMRLA